MQEDQLCVKCFSYGKSSDGTVTLRHYTSKERRARALKVSAIVFLCALIAVCIPVAHFILVPMLLILSPISGCHVYRRKDIITGGAVTCPACKASVPVFPTPYLPVLSVACAACHRSIEVALGGTPQG